MKAVITVIGRDTVGVVAKVSAVCAELNINIEDPEHFAGDVLHDHAGGPVQNKRCPRRRPHPL